MIPPAVYRGERASPKIKRGKRGGVLALMIVLVVSAMVHAQPAPFPVIGTQAPDFTLIDQREQRIQLRQFRGRLILLNFIYTHCVDVCPIVTTNLVKVQRALLARRWGGQMSFSSR